METLLVVAEHRNQYYSKGKVAYYGPGRSGSLPSGNFRDINCRTFQSGADCAHTRLYTRKKKSGIHGSQSKILERLFYISDTFVPVGGCLVLMSSIGTFLPLS